MNTEFEMVAFEMQDERGGRRGGARGPRPSPGRAWPARPRRPAWGGWRYPLLAPWPEPAPYLAPYPAPYPVEDDEPQDEQPASIAPALARMAAAPNYKPYGALRDAAAKVGANLAGLYLIEFDGPAGKRAYSGQSDNVGRRLRQHLLCATMLGLDVGRHRVFVAAAPSAAARRRTEKDLHAQMGVKARKPGDPPGVLTNQRKELEAELLGEFWG
ncbi:GIY-YIG nuclease family protein [Massilia atriviolacea]|uniref:GIY-YIG nuclease family protein n=1 Tax=Massilia atriviolacea TaxID=2495579 RepID=A0A430HK27_9BURK|nr:GIY-YIG nuclease family protein [Massilia atriviolacea]RSZ57851.1 GIY-YIG nuclease family protein [Massilia atriviolacea]